VPLMWQYPSQNQAVLAAQIARQILRRGPSTPSSFGGRGGRGGLVSETDPSRSAAIGVLARFGQLKEMIERAEAQLKASPKSVQIHQALSDYYYAAEDR